MGFSIEEKAAARKELNWDCDVDERRVRGAIGAEIRRLRDCHFVSQIELARAIGYESATAIALIENGSRSVSAHKLLCIAKFFGVSISHFQP